MARPGDPRAPENRVLVEVGGPEGIRVEGANVRAGALVVGAIPEAAPPAALGAGAGPGGPGPQAMVAFERGASLLARHPGVFAGALAFGGALATMSAAIVIHLLLLPWLLFVVPALFGAGAIGGAAVLFAKTRRRGTAGLDPEVEGRLLRLAVAREGQLTVTDVAVGLGIPLADADRALTSLARAGHATAANDAATGALVFVFPDIQAGRSGPERRLL